MNIKSFFLYILQKILYPIYYRLFRPLIKIMSRLITKKSEIVRISELQDTLSLSLNNNKLEKSI